MQCDAFMFTARNSAVLGPLASAVPAGETSRPTGIWAGFQATPEPGYRPCNPAHPSIRCPPGTWTGGRPIPGPRVCCCRVQPQTPQPQSSRKRVNQSECNLELVPNRGGAAHRRETGLRLVLASQTERDPLAKGRFKCAADVNGIRAGIGAFVRVGGRRIA